MDLCGAQSSMLPFTQELSYQSGPSCHDAASLLQAAGSLVSLGSSILANGGRDEEATAVFDVAYNILKAPTMCSVNELWSAVAKHLELERCPRRAKRDHFASDLYQEGECDVGPRILRTPVAADFYTTYRKTLLEAIIWFNKGLMSYSRGAILEAKQLFEIVAFTLQDVLRCTTGVPSVSFMELAMRTFNNLGLIEYLEKSEGLAAASFETAIHFAKQLVREKKEYSLEYATTLSNLCRVSWMRGDVGVTLYKNLKDILRVRVAALPWHHPDVAAARYNMAVAEYARQDGAMAASQLRQYLAIAAHRSKHYNANDLDAIPAIVFLLLIENEDKEDKTSQELVRGLRALQDKRQDEGADSPDLAAVLNFVGALLFHQKDFENALLFFWEELRLEEKIVGATNDSDGATSVRVTCNNIGRILQELGRYREAMHYYERALKADFGNINEATTGALKATTIQIIADTCKTDMQDAVHKEASFSKVNLYSTVWYNLGLINDKLGLCEEAINAFELSLGLREAMLGPDHPDVACLLYNIGVLQMEASRLPEASASLRKALSIRHIDTTGQLNDRHVIKTLERLASHHEAKTDFTRAIEALKSVLAIQQASVEFGEADRLRDMGITLRSISDIYSTAGELRPAIEAAAESVRNLRAAAGLNTHQADEDLSSDRITTMEQFVSSLLSLGSLLHETCEPLQAEEVLREAARITSGTRNIFTRQASIYALHGVTNMLATCHCAPVA